MSSLGNFQQPKPYGLVFSQHLPMSDSEKTRVTDLAGRTGDGHSDWWIGKLDVVTHTAEYSGVARSERSPCGLPLSGVDLFEIQLVGIGDQEFFARGDFRSHEQ